MNKRVLIIDDEVNLVELLKVNFKAAGFDVITALDGEEGLNKALNEALDLVILDIRMPKMDGWEVCSKLKDNPKTKNMPVIIITAAAQTVDINKAKELNCGLLLTKPFSPEKLVEVATKFIEGKTAESKRRVLVVEDDTATSKLLKIDLEPAGYEVDTAFDGEKALEMVDKKKYDLIILDIMLPKIDGYEVCDALRKKDATRLTPVIMLSGKSQVFEKLMALKLGADDYITKPFNLEELLARVDTVLKRSDQALSANPLTKLPGNLSIIQEINQRLSRNEKFAFAYFDIDNFKAYNDKYSYEKGDLVINFTAELIRQNAGSGDFIGHIGGDDFVLICKIEEAENICKKIAESFDKKILQFYDAADSKRGYITAVDRKGQSQNFPLMTLSVGIVTNESKELNHHAKIVEAANEMKKYAKLKKQGQKSNVVSDRRK